MTWTAFLKVMSWSKYLLFLERFRVLELMLCSWEVWFQVAVRVVVGSSSMVVVCVSQPLVRRMSLTNLRLEKVRVTACSASLTDLVVVFAPLFRWWFRDVL